MSAQFDLLSEWIRTSELRSPLGRDSRLEFWNNELRKTWSVLMDHEEFYIAYLRKKAGLEEVEATATNGRLSTDDRNGLYELISASAGYFRYVQSKLDQFRAFQQNSYFLRA